MMLNFFVHNLLQINGKPYPIFRSLSSMYKLNFFIVFDDNIGNMLVDKLEEEYFVEK